MYPIPARSSFDEQKQEDERREGTIEDSSDALYLELSDSEINSIIGKRVDKSKAWWNKELNLDAVREKSERYYLNKSYDERDLYEYQIPYKNNRILTDIEVLVPLSVSQPAEPVVTEANDSDGSRQLAKDLSSSLLALYEDLYIKAKLTTVARNLYIGKRIGILKYRFDTTLGKMNPDGSRGGAITVEAVRPEKIVFCEETGYGENPRFIAEYCTATIEELVSRFPDKKDEIFKSQGIIKGTKSQLQRLVGYLEVWFSYFDKEGTKKEAVCWKLDEVILDKMKNPNWNYDEYEVDQLTGKAVRLNFLDFPQKPYILFNHLNLGKHVLDDTSLIENAIPQQDILNKRGRQIAENADQAAAGLVFNSNMISQDDAAKLIGDPTEKIMVDGDVRSAVTRLPYNQLPAYVQQDKIDARSEIDNIIGANAPLQGQNSGLDTLGQEVLSQRANLGRLQTIADVIEDGMDRLYKALVQMMKVYWDEPQTVTFEQADGKTEFLEMSRDKIEDGVKVRVKTGSVLPKDKIAVRNETIQAMGVLDPLSIAEGLDKNNPKEFAKRLVYYRFFMDKYLSEILGDSGDGTDAQATADLKMLLKGEVPPLPREVSQAYLGAFDTFLNSESFKKMDPQTQQSIVEYVRMVTEKAKAEIGEGQEEAAPQEQLPPEGAPEEAPAEEVPAPAEDTAAPVQPPEQGGNIIERGVKAFMGRFKKK